MGYGSESLQGGLVRDSTSLATIPLQTPADKSTWHVLAPMTVSRLCIMVTTAPTVADAVVALDRRVLTGSDTGRTEIARITIPIATAIGKVVYKDFAPVDLDMGDQLVIELVTASTAGAGVVSVLAIPRAESAVNQADAVKSA